MKCTHDNCFTCPYPDCISDEVTADDYRRQDEFDMEILETREKALTRERARRYYEKHREEKLMYQRERYKLNAEEMKRKIIEWQRKNRDYVNAKARERYWRKKDDKKG